MRSCPIYPILSSPFPDEIDQEWSDIAIHGESANTWASEQDPPEQVESFRTPYYNLIEGNNLEYLCVDATHQHNGTHNTFINNRVTEQIHVMGYDGFTDGLPHAVIYSSIFITGISTLCGSTFPVLQFNLSEGWDEAFFGWELGFDLGLYMSYQLFDILSLFCCKDCLSFRIADLSTQLNHNSSNHTHKFQNQPKQIFINNYARECNWWKSVIQDYPVRMHSEIASSKNNRRKHYATWWGGTQKKTIHRNAAFDDLQTCYITG